MKKILCFLLINPVLGACAQEYKTKMDALEAPASVAFSILNLSNSDILRPTDATPFSVGLQNATKNFTSLPHNLGFEIAPFLLGRNTPTISKYNNFSKSQANYRSKNLYRTFTQTFTISTGFTYNDGLGTDTNKTTKIGLGIKFSIFRPGFSTKTEAVSGIIQEHGARLLKDFEKLANERYKAELSEMESALLQLSAGRSITMLTDSMRKVYDGVYKAYRTLKDRRDEEIKSIQAKDTSFNKDREAIKSFKIERKRGLNLDFNSGAAFDFPGNQMERGRVFRAGSWLTLTWMNLADGSNRAKSLDSAKQKEGENKPTKIDVLGIVRYYYNPKNVYADPAGLLKKETVSTLDGGVRLIMKILNDRLNFSAEAIYRSVLNKKSVVEPSVRWGFSVDYGVWSNTKLAFSFGKEFDGTYIKGGNVFSALNFIFGFGNDKPIGRENPGKN